MHPIEFKKRWSLTYDQLALVLGYESTYTLRCWAIKGKHHRNPQGNIFVLCGLLNEKWEREGKVVDSYLSRFT
ncbi:hypothetical protein FNW02_28945 [Komarekiella sp. 'clone 1']|uniref:Uncharacterized protein n=1 Tax=Komarekiella delphini-convector SJRDD-AB1 TaxID=2593771 RepID=A0AA40T322_9NOST|nr:hypothetical protein [Komarekiella delphini-convector]MBD6619734.1 hypothetical protein [Komarekiella delphini-convector SJRDD-AB1]